MQKYFFMTLPTKTTTAAATCLFSSEDFFSDFFNFALLFLHAQ
jgi:hypothetical protein